MPQPLPSTQIDKREAAAATAAIEDPPLESIVLPGGLTLGAAGLSAVNLDEVLSKIPGLPFTGSSAGGFSAHKLADATCWRRFYLMHILGMVPINTKTAFQRGSLYHAVMAMRYTQGPDRQFEPLERAAEAGLADIAYQVKAMCVMQFEKFGLQEWQTWCVRDVEQNMIAWLPCRFGKKTVPVPLSCRADMILALKRTEEAHPVGRGPLPQGVYICDWKTSSGITKDLIEGFGMDFQFTVECAIFKLGRYEEVYGPLRGVMVSIASTARKQPTFDDFVRIEAPMPAHVIDTFIEQELRPLVTEAYERVTSDETRADINQWPCDRRQCIGRWGRCDMFDYCDRGTTIGYRIEQPRVMTTDSLVKPPAGWKPVTEAPAAADGGNSEPKKKATTSAANSAEVKMLAESILSQIEGEQAALPGLDRAQFLTPGHTFISVCNALSASLKATYEGHAVNKTVFPLGGMEWRFQKTGLAWKDADGDRKGRVTWRAVAEWICRNAWFNLATALPG
jgi:hypothetical protein